MWSKKLETLPGRVKEYTCVISKMNWFETGELVFRIVSPLALLPFVYFAVKEWPVAVALFIIYKNV